MSQTYPADSLAQISNYTLISLLYVSSLRIKVSSLFTYLFF